MRFLQFSRVHLKESFLNLRIAVLTVVGVGLMACGGDPSSEPGVGSAQQTLKTNGGGPAQADVIGVSKCYTNATATTGGEMLIKANSSNSGARLFAYRPDGTLVGEVQNGGGGRYGGTVMPHQLSDPGTVTVKSSAGGSITVPTTPFQI